MGIDPAQPLPGRAWAVRLLGAQDEDSSGRSRGNALPHWGQNAAAAALAPRRDGVGGHAPISPLVYSFFFYRTHSKMTEVV